MLGRTNKTQSQQKERNNKDHNRKKVEMTKTIDWINETKIWFLKKINKIDKPLARLIKEKERGLKSRKL